MRILKVLGSLVVVALSGALLMIIAAALWFIPMQLAVEISGVTFDGQKPNYFDSLGQWGSIGAMAAVALTVLVWAAIAGGRVLFPPRVVTTRTVEGPSLPTGSIDPSHRG